MNVITAGVVLADDTMFTADATADIPALTLVGNAGSVTLQVSERADGPAVTDRLLAAAEVLRAEAYRLAGRDAAVRVDTPAEQTVQGNAWLIDGNDDFWLLFGADPAGTGMAVYALDEAMRESDSVELYRALAIEDRFHGIDQRGPLVTIAADGELLPARDGS